MGGEITKERDRRREVEEEDGWVTVSASVVRIVLCFVTMMMTTLVWAMIMVFLLPWPYARIRQGNVYGHLTGWLLVSG